MSANTENKKIKQKEGFTLRIDSLYAKYVMSAVYGSLTEVYKIQAVDCMALAVQID